MVKTTNGLNTFEVTRGAFDGIYSRQGYTIVKKDELKEIFNEPALSEDEMFLIDIQEKPISQWSKEEVKRFASLKGVNISGTKNVGEAKNLIKDFLDSKSE